MNCQRHLRLLLTLSLLLLPARASAQVFWQVIMPDLGDVFTFAGSGGISGRLPAPGAVGEVAVAEAVLHPGELVPLPVYADGTPAIESEIFWLTQLSRLHFPANRPCVDLTPRYTPGDYCSGGFNGRVWGGGSAALNNDGSGGQCTDRSTNVEVKVTVIAVRSAAVTPTRSGSWGSVKSSGR